MLSCILLSCFLSVCSPNAADTAKNDFRLAQDRPKIGLVLAGGGAKGASHIGVLRYLEEHNIPIDYIAGTSMGSIVGGLYALGYSADELEELISRMDWPFYLTDGVERNELSFNEKYIHDSYRFNVPFTMKDPESKEHLKNKDQRALMNNLPSGAVSGYNVVNLLNSLCVGYTDSLDFDSLPIPFACISANIIDGSEVVHRSGNLPMAIRASMSLPGIFSPVYTEDGKVLMDGGLVNNMPVDVVKQMGADIVIGVNLSIDKVSDPLLLQSLPSQISQLLKIVTGNGVMEHREMCDILLLPDMTGYGTLSFNPEAIRTIVSRGYNEAKQHEEEFIALENKLKQYGQPQQYYNNIKANSALGKYFTLSDIVFDGIDQKDVPWFIRKTGLETGKYIDSKTLDEAVSLIIGTQAFTEVNYILEEDGLEGDYILHFKLKEAKPNVFSLSLRYDTHDAMQLGVRIGINEQKMSGFRLASSFKFSYNPSGSLLLAYVPKVWPRICLSYDFLDRDADLFATGLKHTSSLSYLRHDVKLYLSEYHLRRIDIKGGFASQMTNYRRAIFSYTNTFDQKIKPLVLGGLFFDINLDNLDDPYFAKEGLRSSINFYQNFWQYRAGGIEYRPYTSLDISIASYLSLSDKLCLIPQIYAGLNYYRYGVPEGESFDFSTIDYSSDMPFYLYPSYHKMIGGAIPNYDFIGQKPFVGLYGSYPVENSLILRCDIRYNLFEDHYLTAKINYGHTPMWETFFTDTSYEDLLGAIVNPNKFGVALEYSIDTMGGPLSAEIGWSDYSKSIGAFLSFGYSF